MVARHGEGKFLDGCSPLTFFSTRSVLGVEEHDMGNTSCCYGGDKRQRAWEEWDDSGGGAGGRFDAIRGDDLVDGEAPPPYRNQMSLPPQNPGDPAAWRRYNPQARRESFGLRGKLIGGRFRVEETM